MRAGQFVEIGLAEQVLHQPKNVYARPRIASRLNATSPTRFLLFTFDIQTFDCQLFPPGARIPPLKYSGMPVRSAV
jgi:hypothetical protein